MERLSGLDATFLYLETPNNHMHVCAVMVLDPSTVPGGYSFEKVKDVIRGRLHLVEQFRRRLVTVPFALAHPLWIEDPDFDLDYHVRRVAVPSPGGPHELGALAGEIASRQLDRSKPLWELWVVEGLEDDNIAVVAKMHHATIDGVSGANMMTYLFDLEVEPAEPSAAPEHEWRPERKPSDAELVGHAVRSRLTRPLALASVIPSTAKAVINVARGRIGAEGTTAPAPFSAPRTAINTAITPHRSVAFTTVSLDDVKMVKNAVGTTVNDVILGICGGALMRYLADQGEHPDKPLVAVAPISVRTDDDKRIGANKVSAMFTSLATDVDDPIERLHAINEKTKAAKEEHNAIGANFLQDWSEFAAPTLFGLAGRLYSSMKLASRHRPIHNLVISNVPGPPFPLFLGGARLLGMFPLGPIMDGAALNITVLSYIDSVGFGFMACRETLPDLWNLAGYIDDALEELKKAAEGLAK